MGYTTKKELGIRYWLGPYTWPKSMVDDIWRLHKNTIVYQKKNGVYVHSERSKRGKGIIYSYLMRTRPHMFTKSARREWRRK